MQFHLKHNKNKNRTKDSRKTLIHWLGIWHHSSSFKRLHLLKIWTLICLGLTSSRNQLRSSLQLMRYLNLTMSKYWIIKRRIKLSNRKLHFWKMREIVCFKLFTTLHSNRNFRVVIIEEVDQFLQSNFHLALIGIIIIIAHRRWDHQICNSGISTHHPTFLHGKWVVIQPIIIPVAKLI